MANHPAANNHQQQDMMNHHYPGGSVEKHLQPQRQAVSSPEPTTNKPQ